jgi:2'-hydroxyisoflavone reductase
VRILVLGGTSFVGRAIVADALRTGAEVTLFSRGKTGTGLFPGVARLTGDRDTGDYAALGPGRWDAVVDTSGYVPRHVGQAMDALGDRAGRYLFISSHAVYRYEGLEPGSTEDTPRRPPVRDTEELGQDTYGPLKVACEDDVAARYGDRATIVRPGKVAGPHDWQPGLTYWPGAQRAVAGLCCRATRSSRSRSLTRGTWPAWSCGCSRTAGAAPSTRSARPRRSRWAA